MLYAEILEKHIDLRLILVKYNAQISLPESSR